MKLSYRWLSEFVKIDDIEPENVALQLTMSTSEIEGVEETGDDLEKVVVGKILQVDAHPRSDHLFLTKIDVGKEILDIVSGAPNTKKGTHVPVALIGAELPDGTRVQQAKLRGCVSCGMVCSEKELGVSDDHSGLWILDQENVDGLKPGERISSLFPTKDFIIDIDNKSITNRPDLWGHYGFARELAAVYGRELAPVYSHDALNMVHSAQGSEGVEIQIDDPVLCPRYTALVIGGIKIQKSSFILRRRLYTLGVRPIYNIVDVTNYVMLEIGQPLHAFDASQIAQERIIVRRARKGEKITTLDGVQRELTEETLLITDPEKPVAVAGVMGGLNSEISDTTEKIIIEAANFHPTSVRRTAVRLGLRTEASNRFEKSLDPELTVLGIVGSMYRIKRELIDAFALSPLLDEDFSEKKNIRIPLDIGWVSRLLGEQVEKNKVVSILSSLQFGIEDDGEEQITVTVPSFRATKDISIPQDLVEEVGRIHGYENIEPRLPHIENAPPLKHPIVGFERRMKTLIAERLAMTEVYTYSFQEDREIERFFSAEDSFVMLKNPVSANMSRLRRSLIPGLFALVERNRAFRDEFAIFEIGSVYVPRTNEAAPHNKRYRISRDGVTLPDERCMAAGLLLRQTGNSPVFYDLKGKVVAILNALGLYDARFHRFDTIDGFEKRYDLSNLGNLQMFHPGRRALMTIADSAFGMISELNPKLLRDIGVDFKALSAAVFDIDLDILLGLVQEAEATKKYQKLPKYPEVSLALAVVVDESVSVREVRDFILSQEFEIDGASSRLMERVELFDIYRGRPLAEHTKNLAFNLFYRRNDRTLTEKEANLVHEELAKRLRDHGWELR